MINNIVAFNEGDQFFAYSELLLDRICSPSRGRKKKEKLDTESGSE
jgi:hypothetical protein